MNAAKLKQLVQDRIDYLNSLDEVSDEDDYHNVRHFVQDVYGHAVAIGLPTVAAACNPGPPMIRLLEILRSFPKQDSDTLTPPQIAKEISVSPDTVRGWIDSGQLKASNVAKPGKRPRWKVARQDLEAFLEKRQPDARPPKKRKPKLLVEKY